MSGDAADSAGATGSSPFVVARACVRAVDRVSPTFVRVTFGGDGLDALGDVGRVFDQRIKLVFPSASGTVPDLAGEADWYAAWLDLPLASRGPMRTYSIRELRVGPDGTQVVVDFVLHLRPGLTGPAARWADGARPGDELLLVGPRRGRSEGSGIEYAPGAAGTVMLVGDETAAPAIARILEDCPRGVRGAALIEVPVGEDALPIAAPAGVDVRWLPRDGRPHGAVLLPTVLGYLDAGHLGASHLVAGGGDPGNGTAGAAGGIPDDETDELLWETPRYSGLGEPLAPRDNVSDRYFWIAGESGVVTTLRRQLVSGLGVGRAQVAFMGYWRKGVAMRA